MVGAPPHEPSHFQENRPAGGVGAFDCSEMSGAGRSAAPSNNMFEKKGKKKKTGKEKRLAGK